MKEATSCTGAGIGGGTGRLGFSNKGYPDAKYGGVELGLKIKEEPPLVCNHGDCGGVYDAYDGKRPTFKETGTPLLSNTCHFAAASAGDSTTVAAPAPAPAPAPAVLTTALGYEGSTGSSAVRSPLQPFDISHPTYYPFLKSAGSGGMATTLGFFPFTAAQWKELQRQAMIYKYMVACVPVPHDLLFPVDPSGSACSWGNMGMFNVKWVGNGKDVEPGRCKRTDGKKWRCSKDVAPNQKYCERHLNRGRPRSRKPVEAHAGFSISSNSAKGSAKKTRLGDSQNSSFNLLNLKTGANPSSSAIHCSDVGCPVQEFDGHHQGSSGNPFASMLPSLNEEARKWMVKDEGAEQQWQQMQMKNLKLATDGPFYHTNSAIFQHHFVGEPIDSSSDLDYSARGFPVAWSNGLPESNADNGSGQRSSVLSDGKITFPSLALSMGGSNLIDEEMGSIHMDHCGVDSSGNHGQGLLAGWINTNPGGPLAEVLRPRPICTIDSAGNGDLVTPPSTTVSSPSGVIQKTLASFSDSSGSNSPACEDRKSNSQIPFQWLS